MCFVFVSSVFNFGGIFVNEINRVLSALFFVFGKDGFC